MTPLAVLRRYYPDVRLEIRPGGTVAVHDPRRREGIANYVRAYEKEIWAELLKESTTSN